MILDLCVRCVFAIALICFAKYDLYNIEKMHTL